PMLLSRFLRPGSRPRRAARRELGPVSQSSFPPRLEVLEDRTLPSTFTVINLNDSGPGSLRAAIVAADAKPGADVIDFQAGLRGPIPLAGELDITTGPTIDGPGPSLLTVSGNGASRVFEVSTSKGATISGLRIADGLADQGAGIDNTGKLTLSNDVLSGND